MRISLDTQQDRFREEVASFLAAELPADIAQKVRLNTGVDKDDAARWTRILNSRGWAAPAWPEEHGGTGWSLVQRHVFDVECRRVHAPVLSGFGFNMVGPAIIKYGSAEQQAHFLPKILNADLWWCQGYSEPQAGSDLASLRTTAVKSGDDYIVNGQKIWTSGAEVADWMFCLVRTDAGVQKQKGISFLLIDLNSPGITIKPLYAFNGKRLWNEVFLDDVRVPVSNRLGEEDRGWTVAKSLLGDERLMVSRVAENKRMFGILREVISAEAERGADVEGYNFDAMSKQLSELEIRLSALETMSLRLLSAADGGGQIGAEPSMLKLKGSELIQAMDEVLFDAVGLWVLPLDTRTSGDGNRAVVGPDYAEFVASGRYHHRGYTIAGGSSEVQHNIIAKLMLGL